MAQGLDPHQKFNERTGMQEARFSQPPPGSVLLAVLTLIQFCHTLDFVILMPLGPQLIRTFGISPAKFGLLVSAYSSAAAVSGLLVAIFIDRLERKTAILSLFAVFTVATLACALAGGYESLFLARILAGASGGVLQALIFAVVADVIPEHRRGRATGMILSAFSIASIVGIPIGLFLASRFDWQAPFFMLVGVCAVGGFLGHLVLPRIRRARSQEESKGGLAELVRLGSVFRVARHRWALLLNLSLTFGMFCFLPYLNPHFVTNVGLPEKEISTVYLVGGLFTVVGARVTGWLADQYGKLEVFQVAALMAIAPILIVSHLTETPLWIVLVCSTLFMVLMNARFVPATAMMTSAARAEMRGAFLSVNSSLQHMTMSLAALAGGAVVEWGGTQPGQIPMDRLGWVAAGFGLLTIPVARALRRRIDADEIK